MGLGTINTILNTAPILIQGATKLVQLLKQPKEEPAATDYDIPATIDDVKVELEKLHQRLNTQNDASIEQVNLIRGLAEQNKAIASTLRSTTRQLNFISFIAVFALVVALICLIWLVLYN